ncbi:aspartate dehydrogenase [Rubrivivax sp. JA1024]|nr:aspartate dehydrogenase [Rubrivivax sp. JA1024]
MTSSRPVQRVAIAGLGAIGKAIARELDRGGIDGMVLTAVASADPAKHRGFLQSLHTPPRVRTAERLWEDADLVIEAAPSRLLRAIVEPFVSRGKSAIVLSAAALLDAAHLIDIAKAHGGQIIVPTGALIGLDAVSAAAVGTIHSVRMITRKPVDGFRGAPFVIDNGIDLDRVDAPLKLFEGTAREAGKGFPANLNVAVALSLAGIGPDRTIVEIWADPGVTRNTHRIEVDADSARFSMTIENVPSENPKTGIITALSAIALLRKTNAAMRIGT